jgi:hypothetical protein
VVILIVAIARLRVQLIVQTVMPHHTYNQIAIVIVLTIVQHQQPHITAIAIVGFALALAGNII